MEQSTVINYSSLNKQRLAMGLKCGRMCSRICYQRTPELRIGLLGLDNAGKTTILYQLKLERNIEARPTFGLNVESIEINNLIVNIWEVGGSGKAKARILWQHYNQHTRAIIFVVDSTDLKRLPEAAESLQWLCWQQELSDAVFLIYANKQDLPGALPATQLAELFELSTLLPRQKWVVQACCALTGVGLREGMQKLLYLIDLDRRSDKLCNLHNMLRHMK